MEFRRSFEIASDRTVVGAVLGNVKRFYIYSCTRRRTRLLMANYVGRGYMNIKMLAAILFGRQKLDIICTQH